MLGRDAVLRKTMLDECRGERLEDVLVAFSSAVLKKSVAEGLGACDGDGSHPPISQQLALQNLGYSSFDGRTQQQIVVLIIAHKASLSNLLRRKSAARARLNDFGELLDIKRRGISRRTEQLREVNATEGRNDEEDDDKQEVWRTVRSNWSGNEQWLEAILHGDANVRRDGVLSASFDKVWRRVHAGRLAELEQTPKHGSGLLDELQRKVQAQQTKVWRWKEFHSRAFGANAATGSTSPSKKGGGPQSRSAPSNGQRGLDLGFNSHGALRLGYLSPRRQPVGAAGPGRTVLQEYVDLVADLDAELAKIRRGKVPTLASLVPVAVPRKHRAAFAPVAQSAMLAADALTDEPISELSELEDEIEKLTLDKRSGSEPREEARPERPSPTRQWSSISTRGEGRSRSGSPQKKALQQQVDSEVLPQAPDIRPPISSPRREARSPARPRISRNNSQRETFEDLEAHAAQIERNQEEASAVATSEGGPPQQDDLAKQILASVAAASPTPVKKPRHTLSLAERTRLTMSRTSRARGYEDDDTDEEPIDALKLTRGASGKSQVSSTTVPEPEKSDDDHHDDLVARTRKSMANFEAARKKALLERRKSQRKSKQLPQVTKREGGGPFANLWEEEAEHMSGAAEGVPIESLKDTTMLIEGGGDDDDYEAVFRSRPKIKNSPVPTPNPS